jgi:hypothetical protein
MSDISIDEVIVVIDHPAGKIEAPLRTWMDVGPGPRPFVHPTAAKHRDTGEPLPLSVIPIEYRNDEESRALIAAGKIQNPWK